MKRALLQELQAWKTHPLRKPLILRGARQVGKSWLVKKFGQQFETYIEINFEESANACPLFQGELLMPQLLEKLNLYSGKSIVPGKTLLFLDEIQLCEQALIALRYFKEKCPELHVIAAGSLLEFSIEKIGMSVGRLQFLYLYPFSFYEFLVALGREDLAEYIQQERNEEVIHQQLLELLKTYFWLGGMPAVVEAWIKLRDVKACQEVQDEIILTYKQDFQKYARKNQIQNVEKMFEAIPLQLGRKFKYIDVDRDSRTDSLKQALSLLEKAGIVHIVYHSSGQGQPLGATKNERRFKVFCFDIGLAQRLLGLDLKNLAISPLEVRHFGAIAEQLVAQEYIAYTSIKSPPELYYWHREEKISNAEVDFLFLQDGKIVPVEVKASSRGGFKSLWLYIESHHNTSSALTISENLYSQNGIVQNIPLYGLKGWLSRSLLLSK